ncbi:hypothetical protein Droror1_Dr00024026 [Drosera rotundifolia]
MQEANITVLPSSDVVSGKEGMKELQPILDTTDTHQSANVIGAIFPGQNSGHASSQLEAHGEWLVVEKKKRQRSHKKPATVERLKGISPKGNLLGNKKVPSSSLTSLEQISKSGQLQFQSYGENVYWKEPDQVKNPGKTKRIGGNFVYVFGQESSSMKTTEANTNDVLPIHTEENDGSCHVDLDCVPPDPGLDSRMVEEVELMLVVSVGFGILREELWNYLVDLRHRIVDPWLALGDFNEICTPGEVVGSAFCEARAMKMISMMDECNLIDLGATGSKFTWERKKDGHRELAKRLDRALGDFSWLHAFPEAYVEHLSRVYSDHSPLLLRCDTYRGDHTARPFRFLTAWSTYPSYEPLVAETWSRQDVSFRDFGGSFPLLLHLSLFPNPHLTKAAMMVSSPGAPISMLSKDHLALKLLNFFAHVLWLKISTYIPQLETIKGKRNRWILMLFGIVF